MRRPLWIDWQIKQICLRITLDALPWGLERSIYFTSQVKKKKKKLKLKIISPDYAAPNNTCDLNPISMLSFCKSRLAKWASVYDRISNYSLVLTVWNRWITAPLYMLNRFDGWKYHDEIFFLAFFGIKWASDYGHIIRCEAHMRDDVPE